VGNASVYKVTVQNPPGVSMTIKPDVLSFTTLGEKQSFNVVFTGAEPRQAAYFGAFTWSDGK
jgi:hypothetical protein